jgi:hypothetical protein
MEEQFELRILESFDPMTQDKTGFHPATIHKQSKNSKAMNLQQLRLATQERRTTTAETDATRR